MRWFRRKPLPDAPAPEPDDDEVEYAEPERGPFDHPHRIRSKELLNEEFEQPLPTEAASAALVHHEQSRRALEAWNQGYGGEISWLDGIETAEIHDPDAIRLRQEHEMSKIRAEIGKQIDTPFIQRMIAIQMTVQRWKRKITK